MRGTFQLHHAAPTSGVRYSTSMDGSLADETVRAIDTL